MKASFGDAESHINWASHVDFTYNLIRGCNPAPGAWTTLDGKKLFLFECTKRIARTFSEVKGKKIGQVVAQNGSSLVIHGQGGFIEVQRVRWDGGRKIAAGEAELAGRRHPGRLNSAYESLPRAAPDCSVRPLTWNPDRTLHARSRITGRRGVARRVAGQHIRPDDRHPR